MLYNFYKINENDTLRSNIKQEVQKNEYVELSEIVDGDWDNIIIVNPYTDKAEINNKYGIAVNRISDFSVAHRDDRVLIIFCKGKSIQNYIYWSGSIFSSEDEKIYNSIKIKKEDTKFKADKTSDNNTPLNLIHIKKWCMF